MKSHLSCGCRIVNALTLYVLSRGILQCDKDSGIETLRDIKIWFIRTEDLHVMVLRTPKERDLSGIKPFWCKEMVPV